MTTLKRSVSMNDLSQSEDEQDIYTKVQYSHMYTKVQYSHIYTQRYSTIICYTGRREIAPTRNCTPLFKNVLNPFVCIKLNFFPTIFLSLSDLFP